VEEQTTRNKEWGRLSRRAFLRATAIGGGGLLAAYAVGCGDGDGGAAPTATGAATEPAATPTKQPGASTLRWRRLEPAGELPTPRRDHTLVTDGERLVLFGGRDPSPLDDTWIYSIASNQWERSAADTRPAARFGHNAAWDRASNNVLVFGGQAGASFFNDLWAFDPETWQWIPVPLGSAAVPAARYGAGGALDGAGRLLVTHGFTTQGRFDDTWAFGGGAWSDVSPAGARPIERCLMRAVYDTAGERLLIFGGQTTGTPFLGDTWLLEPAGWRDVTAGGGPSPRNFYALVFDALAGRALLFGGNTADGDTNDLWAFDSAGERWSQPAVEGEPPSRRDGHDAAIAGERLYVFGGAEGNTNLNDLWVLELAS
jgi:hypothetical protein